MKQKEYTNAKKKKKLEKKHSSFGKAVLLRKWQRVAHSNHDMHTCVLFSEYTQHKTHTPVHSYILRLSLSLLLCLPMCVYICFMCNAHSNFMYECRNRYKPVSTQTVRSLSYFLVLFLSFPLTHRDTHTYHTQLQSLTCPISK